MKFTYNEHPKDGRGVVVIVADVVCLQTLSDGSEIERLYSVSAAGRTEAEIKFARSSVFLSLNDLNLRGEVEEIGRLA